MGILTRADTPTVEQRLRKTHEELIAARRELGQVKAERDAYRDQLDGRSDGMWWVQAKVNRQRKALDDLNKRNTNLRFAVKVWESLHGPLTREQWVAARTALADEQHKARIDSEPVAV